MQDTAISPSVGRGHDIVNTREFADIDFRMLINGVRVSAASGEKIDVENPANEEIIAQISAGDAADAQRALETAQTAQPAWAATPAIERANVLQALADKVVENRDHLARLLTTEQGKVISLAYVEVDATVNYIRFAAESARRIEGDIFPSDAPNEQIWIQRVPYGVTVGLLAWNFPLALAGRKVGPALVAGNAMVLKPPTDTPLTVLEFGRLAKEAGIPDGVLNVVTGRGSQLGDALVRNPITRLVTLTGSTRAGQQLYHAAAQNITALRLELGGKAPFIVMEDADINLAVEAAVGARFANCGQVCTCNERMYLHEAIYDEFMDKFLPAVAKVTVGDPFTDVDMGPKVNRSEIEHLESLVNTAVAQGATVALGGNRLREGEFSRGYWFEPTVLTDVRTDMDIMQTEIFGPIIPVQKVTDFDEAIRFANDCEYGLSAYLFTVDIKRIMRAVDCLDFGEVYVNRGIGEMVQGFHNGFKKSGIGGEDGKHGLENYLQKKTLYVNYG